MRVLAKGKGHILEVSLSDVERKALGRLQPERDATEVLAALRDRSVVSAAKLDEQLKTLTKERQSVYQKTAKSRRYGLPVEAHKKEQVELKHIGRNLKKLATIVKGGEVPEIVRRSGINVRVRILGPRGRRIYVSKPIAGERLDRRFKEAWSVLEDRWVSVGIPRRLVNEWRKRCEDDIERYHKVRSLHAAGLEPIEISPKVGVKTATVSDWLNSGKPPFSLRWVFHEAPRRVEYDIPREESPEFAYLLGVYASATKAARKELIATSQDRDAVEHFADCVKKVFGVRPRVGHHSASKDTPLHGCNFQSVNVLSYMRRITAGNKIIPWEHIVTERERRAYLNGLLDFNSGVTHKKLKDRTYAVVEITFTNRHFLTNDVMVLCGLHEIYPQRTTEKGRIERIEINGRTDIGKVQAVGFHSQRKTDKLEREIRESEYFQPDYGPSEYERARTLARGGLSLRGISGMIGADKKPWPVGQGGEETDPCSQI